MPSHLSSKQAFVTQNLFTLIFPSGNKIVLKNDYMQDKHTEETNNLKVQYGGWVGEQRSVGLQFVQIWQLAANV